MKPWLLLDVDGVLNLDVSASAARRRGLIRRGVTGPDGGRYVVNLDLEHGVLVRSAFEFQIGWATTWNELANVHIAPVLRLEPAPVAVSYVGDKAPGILDLVGFDPFVWIDDEPSQADRDMLEAHGGPHLILVPDPTWGLTANHIAAAVDWASRL